MAPHVPLSPGPDMFRPRLDEQINLKHPLVGLAALLDASDEAVVNIWVENPLAVLYGRGLFAD